MISLRQFPIAMCTLCTSLVAQTQTQTQSSQQNLFNPQITVFGNTIGRLDDRKVMNDGGDAISNRFNLREVELDIRAPIDPIATGVLILAAEAEKPGEYEVGIEEGYFHLHGLPGLEETPAGLQFRVGRFRPSIGHYNRLHTHDLPHTTRPFSLRTFLGEEGLVQNGIEATFDLLSPSDDFVIGVETAVLNGGSIAIGEDNDGEDPAFAVRLNAALELGEGHDIDLGVSLYEGRSDAAGTLSTHLYAVDGVYRWQPPEGGDANSFILGFEGYLANLEQTAAPASSPVGGFAYAQYQLNQNWYAGARYDYAEMLANDSMNTKTVALFATYYFSEFLRFRGGWEHFDSDDASLNGLDTAWIEFNFVFGAHPPHPFWVHR